MFSHTVETGDIWRMCQTKVVLIISRIINYDKNKMFERSKHLKKKFYLHITATVHFFNHFNTMLDIKSNLLTLADV